MTTSLRQHDPRESWQRGLPRPEKPHSTASGTRRAVCHAVASDRHQPRSLLNNSLKPFRPTKRICLRTHAHAKAMSNLSPSQRRAIELTKLREMALKEGSAATGTSITASRCPFTGDYRRCVRRLALDLRSKKVHLAPARSALPHTLSRVPRHRPSNRRRSERFGLRSNQSFGGCSGKPPGPLDLQGSWV